MKGTLFQRKDGRWETRVYVNGKQITTACKKVKAHAIKQHQDFLRELKKQKQPMPPKADKLKDWLLRWFETYKKGKIDSWQNVERTLNKHILPNCPNIKLNKVTEITITEIINKMPTDRTKKEVYLVFNQAMRMAYVNRLINFDISVALVAPKYKPKEGRAYTQKEVESILQDTANSKYQLCVKLYLVIGCRPNELFEIRKSDVDFNNGIIWVNGTKTDGSKRLVPIFEKTKELLEQIDFSSGGKLVGELTFNGWQCYIRKLNKENKTKWKAKDLRTTFGTRCAEQGVPTKLIAKWMGHAKTETTNKYYVKVLDEFERSQLSKFKPF